MTHLLHRADALLDGISDVELARLVRRGEQPAERSAVDEPAP